MGREWNTELLAALLWLVLFWLCFVIVLVTVLTHV